MTWGAWRIGLRAGGAACAVAGALAWWATGAAAGTSLGPSRTAWYDNSGAQNVTGVTTPSPAKSGELEVAYAPASASVPTQTVPTTPAVPGAPVAPPSGTTGGNTVGNTVAFAAVLYQVPLTSGGQSIDPSSIAATLTLSLDTSTSQGIQSGDLIACPTDDTLWSAGGDQDSGQAPRYSCSGTSVTGNYDSTSQTVTFALGAAQESSLDPGSFSVVIIPGTSPSGAFQAVFNAPDDHSLAVTGETPAGNPNEQLVTPPAAPAPVPAQIGNIGPSDFNVSSPSGPGATATTSVPATPGRAASPLYSSSPAAAHGGLGSSAQRTIGLLVLLGLGALLVVASSRPTRAPRSLLSIGAHEPPSPPS